MIVVVVLIPEEPFEPLVIFPFEPEWLLYINHLSVPVFWGGHAALTLYYTLKKIKTRGESKNFTHLLFFTELAVVTLLLSFTIASFAYRVSDISNKPSNGLIIDDYWNAQWIEFSWDLVMMILFPVLTLPIIFYWKNVIVKIQFFKNHYLRNLNF